jgi:hypothetical protein
VIRLAGAFALAEMYLLVVCGTISACDDFGEIVASQALHLDFLRWFSVSSWRSAPSAGCAASSTGSIPS